jgi:carbamoyl-phosphate synthase small subunit
MAVDTVRSLIGWRPIFGICMGHQILARALGAKTYRLKFGHRGANHPIRDTVLNRIYVTSQNHGYAVDPETLPRGVGISHRNLNDQTVAGLCDPERRVLSVQFHPESRPGPHDSVQLFDYFIRQIQ